MASLRALVPIDKKRMLTRCSLCNAELEDVERCAAMGKVPEAVLYKHDRFHLCRRCNKIYWMGSHWTDMAARSEKIADGEISGSTCSPGLSDR